MDAALEHMVESFGSYQDKCKAQFDRELSGLKSRYLPLMTEIHDFIGALCSVSQRSDFVPIYLGSTLFTFNVAKMTAKANFEISIRGLGDRHFTFVFDENVNLNGDLFDMTNRIELFAKIIIQFRDWGRRTTFEENV